jgi:hypothetical protein
MRTRTKQNARTRTIAANTHALMDLLFDGVRSGFLVQKDSDTRRFSIYLFCCLSENGALFEVLPIFQEYYATQRATCCSIAANKRDFPNDPESELLCTALNNTSRLHTWIRNSIQNEVIWMYIYSRYTNVTCRWFPIAVRSRNFCSTLGLIHWKWIERSQILLTEVTKSETGKRINREHLLSPVYHFNDLQITKQWRNNSLLGN